MSQNRENQAIYIDLDSLFDTRLGTIAEIDKNLITRVLDENYLERINDKFSFLSSKTFKELYNLRDNETLKLSPITNVFKLLNGLIKKMLENILDAPDIKSVSLYVNIYPFNLNEQAQGELLEVLVNETAKLIPIKIINLNKEELTFEHCYKFYDILIMYDYNAFIEHNTKTENFKKASLHNRILISPEIYEKEFKQSDLENFYRKNKLVKGYEPRDVIKLIASPVIILDLVPSSVFSVDVLKYSNDEYKINEEKQT